MARTSISDRSLMLGNTSRCWPLLSEEPRNAPLPFSGSAETRSMRRGSGAGTQIQTRRGLESTGDCRAKLRDTCCPWVRCMPSRLVKVMRCPSRRIAMLSAPGSRAVAMTRMSVPEARGEKETTALLVPPSQASRTYTGQVLARMCFITALDQPNPMIQPTHEAPGRGISLRLWAGRAPKHRLRGCLTRSCSALPGKPDAKGTHWD